MTPNEKRPDGEDESPTGRATEPEGDTVTQQASTTDQAGVAGGQVARVPQQAQPRDPVKLGQRQDSFDPMYRLARNLAESSLLPKDLQGKPANVLIIVMYGQELGLSPAQSLQGLYVVNGRPSMSGQLWFALIRKAGHKIAVTDHTDKACTVTITRGDSGEEHSETFTWADAERAKLTTKDIWRSWPKRMLLWRAGTNCATIICPEVAMGFDLQGAEHADQGPQMPSLAEVAANREKPTPPPAPSAPADDGVTDAEIVEEPPSVDDLSALADAHTGVAQEAHPYDDEADGLFDDQGWPEVAAPGSKQ